MLPKGAAGSVIIAPNAVTGVNYGSAEVVNLIDLNAPNGPFTTSGCTNVAYASEIDANDDTVNTPLVAGPVAIVDATYLVQPQTCILTITDPYGASASVSVTIVANPTN